MSMFNRARAKDRGRGGVGTGVSGGRFAEKEHSTPGSSAALASPLPRVVNDDPIHVSGPGWSAEWTPAPWVDKPLGPAPGRYRARNDNADDRWTNDIAEAARFAENSSAGSVIDYGPPTASYSDPQRRAWDPRTISSS